MSMSEIEKFIRQIIDGMYRYYNYNIEDFSSIDEIGFPWGVSRIQNDGTKTVMLFMTLNNIILEGNIEEGICAKINCTKDNLVKVILIPENRKGSDVQDHLAYLRNSGVLSNNFIVVDLGSRNISISDSSIQNTGGEIASIIEHNVKRQNNRKNALVTNTLIGINILMFIVTSILSKNIIDMDINVLVNLGAKYNTAIEKGQWFRLFTCMFLHGGLMHIAANMYSLFSIGPLVENLYGKYKFIGIYVASGIVASLFSFIFSPYVSIGASGAIFGLMGVLFVFAARERKRLGKDFLISIASTVAVNLYIGYSLPGIDNYAHLGGLLTGAALGLIFKLNNSKSL